ncbi:hypothetical protein HK104_005636 [Borealophlyctis nickersoniae]|nr:hypothetical protein HK104_005636 [Borealophlyctis nickersoniae]
MTRGPSKLKMGLRNLRQRDAETAADAAPDAATEALVRHFAKCIQLANGLLEPLDQEHPQVKGTREFRVDPGLAAKLVGSMPKEIKEAYTLGTIRDKNAVSHLPVVFPGDHREGCYLVTVEGHDGSYGVYTGMCGYIKEDGTSTKTGFGTRHGGHTSKAKQTKGESAFYSAVKKAKDWRMIPILVLCGYSKGELEFAETVVQLSLDTSESRCGLDETMQKEGLLRGADTTRFNGSYSVATWGYHPPKRRPPSAEQLEKLREQVRALPRADFSEVGRLKALGYFSELLRALQKRRKSGWHEGEFEEWENELGYLGPPQPHLQSHAQSTWTFGSIDQLSSQGGFDIIVSNPPYIPPHEYAELDEGVSLWEDRGALLASDSDGVRFHKQIGRLAKAFLLRNEGDRIGGISDGSTPPIPTLVLEVGEGQAQKVVQVLRADRFNQVEAWKDLAGIERTVVTYASLCEAGADDEVS